MTDTAERPLRRYMGQLRIFGGNTPLVVATVRLTDGFPAFTSHPVSFPCVPLQ
jgi:hypothetical protein